jgi:hypothetical protein
MFKPGQSGNPGGRPKAKLADGRTLSDLAKEHTVEALEALVKVLKNSESDAAIVSAATAVLDRAWGRPRQDLGIDVTVNEETSSLLEQARKRAREANTLQ